METGVPRSHLLFRSSASWSVTGAPNIAGVIPPAGCPKQSHMSAASRTSTRPVHFQHAGTARWYREGTNLEAGTGGRGRRGGGVRLRGRPGEQVGRVGVRPPHRHRPLHCRARDEIRTLRDAAVCRPLLPVTAQFSSALARDFSSVEGNANSSGADTSVFRKKMPGHRHGYSSTPVRVPKQ